MKRTIRWGLTVAGLLTLSVGVALRFSPSIRTQLYYGLERWGRNVWKAPKPDPVGSEPAGSISAPGSVRPNAPLRGKVKELIRARIRPLFEPFVPIQTEVEPGIIMMLDPNDLVARIILESGRWEEESWAAIKQGLPAGGTFVDVGAHIGYYSLKAARHLGPAGKVLAIEPNPDTIRKLKENIELSKANTIHVYPVACSDGEADLELFAARRENTGMASLSSENAWRENPETRTVYRVRARPLDDIVEEAGVTRVDVIKIDVEGAELLVLKGARRTLARHSPVLIVEMIESALQAMRTSTTEVKEFLRTQGYTPRRELGMNLEFAK